MSTTGSIANFYVDKDGQEQPIRYKAADLVNKLAPIGFHWENKNDDRDLWITLTYQQKTAVNEYSRLVYPCLQAGPENDYYICTKNEEK